MFDEVTRTIAHPHLPLASAFLSWMTVMDRNWIIFWLQVFHGLYTQEMQVWLITCKLSVLQSELTNGKLVGWKCRPIEKIRFVARWVVLRKYFCIRWHLKHFGDSFHVMASLSLCCTMTTLRRIFFQHTVVSILCLCTYKSFFPYPSSSRMATYRPQRRVLIIMNQQENSVISCQLWRPGYDYE